MASACGCGRLSADEKEEEGRAWRFRIGRLMIVWSVVARFAEDLQKRLAILGFDLSSGAVDGEKVVDRPVQDGDLRREDVLGLESLLLITRLFV